MPEINILMTITAGISFSRFEKLKKRSKFAIFSQILPKNWPFLGLEIPVFPKF